MKDATRDQISAVSLEEQFWQWFQSNSDRLMDLEDEQDLILQELHVELEKVAKGLTFEFSSKEAFGREFIISADGIFALFSTVVRLVALAPTIPDWKIIAFRQPKSTRFVLRFGEHTLSPDELWFSIIPALDRLDLTLYFRKAKKRRIGSIEHASFIALDTALGEFDVETKIGKIDWKVAPADPIRVGLRSFHELPKIVKEWVTPMPALKVFCVTPLAINLRCALYTKNFVQTALILG